MKYGFMLFIAFSMAIISSLLTAFGMADLFSGVGQLILAMFVIIDLGRFLLFNFLVDEWNNLRKVKYLIVCILCLLFVYSGIGVFSKMSSLISSEVKEAMVNITSINRAAQNADIKRTRSEDLAKIAQDEYQNAIDWNKLDYENCLKRAKGNVNAENNCNNTKRRLDKTALTTLQTSIKEADENLSGVEEVTLQESKNKSQISHVLMTICKVSQKKCDNYDDLQFALAVIIFLVIIGTDYLQIAIVLAVNTRKNKRVKKEVVEKKIEEKQEFSVSYVNPTPCEYKPQMVSVNIEESTPKIEIPSEKTDKKPSKKINTKPHGDFVLR